MYRQLAATVGTFVALYGIATFFVILGKQAWSPPPYTSSVVVRLETTYLPRDLFLVSYAMRSVTDVLKYVKWPWQWSWVQDAVWEALNFAVIASVCSICRPHGACGVRRHSVTVILKGRFISYFW